MLSIYSSMRSLDNSFIPLLICFMLILCECYYMNTMFLDMCSHLLIYSITHLFHPNCMWVLLHEYKFVLICVHCTYKQCNCKSWFVYILLLIFSLNKLLISVLVLVMLFNVLKFSNYVIYIFMLIIKCMTYRCSMFFLCISCF